MAIAESLPSSGVQFPKAKATVAAAFGFITLSEAFMMIFDPAVEGYLVDGRRTILFALLLCPLFLMNRGEKPRISDVVNFCTVFIAISFLSLFWSINPEYTLYSSVFLASNYIFAFLLVRRFDFEYIIEIISISFVILIFFSFVISIVWPAMGVEQETMFGGAWSGVFYFKNHLGRYMALAVIIFYVRILAGGRLFPNLIYSFLAIALIIKSGSGTGLVLLFAIICGGGILETTRRHGVIVSSFVVLMGGLFIAGATGLLSEGLLLELLGKDPTLTGRTNVWSAAMYYAAESLFVGHGYSAFFSELSPSREYFGYLSNWTEVPHAHNGFLQLMLDVGLLGAAVASCAYLVTVFRFVLKNDIKWPNRAFLFLALIYITLVNVSEPAIFKFNDLSSVIFFIMFFNASNIARERT